MTTETPAIEAETIDLPASAFPDGMSEAEYRASISKTETPVLTAPERPSHIEEKFWDADTGTIRVEELAKSYSELQQKLSDPTKKADGPHDLKIEQPDANAADEAAPIATAMEAFGARYNETKGQLTDDDFAAIEKVGIPRQFAENYIAGQEAIGREQTAAIFAAAGDEKTLDAAMAWGKLNLSEADTASYNALVNNVQTQRQGVEWLVGKFKAARPSEGKMLDAESGGSDGDLFRSKAEWTSAFNDQRYAKDSAYREDMAAKFARSKSAGTI